MQQTLKRLHPSAHEHCGCRVEPKVIHVNLLTYRVRHKSRELLEPFKIMYTKGLPEIAIPNFSGYNVQLLNVGEAPPALGNALQCWCYALYTAYRMKISLKEVINMTRVLQDYVVQDPGFRQFCERYDIVASDPDAQKEYVSWVKDMMREEGVHDASMKKGMEKAIKIGRIEGMEKGMEKGRMEAMEIVAVNMLKKNLATYLAAEMTGLPVEYIEALKNKL